MTPQTLKMLMMFFLAAALLNLTNYVSYIFYDPPMNKALKFGVNVQVSKTRALTKNPYIISRTIDWTAKLLCDGKSKNVLDAVDESSPTDFQADYKEQSMETNSFYYYNGLRMGPVVCPRMPPGLGPVKPEDRISLEAIEKLYSALQPGGLFEVTSCTPRQTVAIIVPCRERNNQITEFLYSLHPVLMKQQVEYQIFLVEQGNKSQPLNRGKLMNVGFTEAQKMKKNGGWRCIVFHHHDVVPVDSRNLYRCSDQPRQLAVTLDSNRSYLNGGALAIKPQQFLKINGFSNLYVGNDAVYDDLSARLRNANLTITRGNTTIAKYSLLSSTNTEVSVSNQSQTIQTSSPLNLLDGLSSLTYTISSVELRPLYTSVQVDLDTESSSPPETVVSEKLWDKLLNQATSPETKTKSFKKYTAI